jgi:hypothetical protein
MVLLVACEKGMFKIIFLNSLINELSYQKGGSRSYQRKVGNRQVIACSILILAQESFQEIQCALQILHGAFIDLGGSFEHDRILQYQELKQDNNQH